MDLQCEGMEFASEIVVKAAGANLNVTEVPINYHARIGESKLNSISDAWRHIRFLLLSSPAYLFLVPGSCSSGRTDRARALFGVTGGMSLIVAKALLAVAVLPACRCSCSARRPRRAPTVFFLGERTGSRPGCRRERPPRRVSWPVSILVAFGFGFLIYGSVAGWGAFDSAGPGRRPSSSPSCSPFSVSPCGSTPSS